MCTPYCRCTRIICRIEIPFPATTALCIPNGQGRSGARRYAVSLVGTTVVLLAVMAVPRLVLYMQMGSNTFDRANEAVPETMLYPQELAVFKLGCIH